MNRRERNAVALGEQSSLRTRLDFFSDVAHIRNTKMRARMGIKSPLAKHLNFMQDVFAGCSPFQIIKTIIGTNSIPVISPRLTRIGSHEGRENKTMYERMLVAPEPSTDISVVLHLNPKNHTPPIAPDAAITRHHVMLMSSSINPFLFLHSSLRLLCDSVVKAWQAGTEYQPFGSYPSHANEIIPFSRAPCEVHR